MKSQKSNLIVKCFQCGKRWIYGLRELKGFEKDTWICPDCEEDVAYAEEAQRDARQTLQDNLLKN